MKKFTLLLAASLLLLPACAPSNQADQPKTDPPQAEQPVTPPPAVKNPPAQTPEPKTETVVLYYPDAQLMKLYKENRTFTTTATADLPKQALQQWIAGPKHDKLAPLLPASVQVQSVKDLGGGRCEVSFSNDLINVNFGSTLESMFAKGLPLVLAQYGYQEVTVLVEGKPVETIAGHVTFDQPLRADDAAQYEFMQ
ncbi:hypothetical protein CBW65_03265 [Tumebacillus avium]|uniref:GerMN domain-containing protein n=1 Tax=Tumebacillus avium TaxID=1903704 RepID=A0A1Y0IL78_9BACL|nr:GerMN domain-containing protein [Tumebacillus avium]ARU60183.1 hypothetical protein CBW65_03265 [Tumebacillus avium]